LRRQPYLKCPRDLKYVSIKILNSTMFVAKKGIKNHKDCPPLDTSTTNPGRSTANYGDPEKRRIPVETARMRREQTT
jgi:hypothetical protein